MNADNFFLDEKAYHAYLNRQAAVWDYNSGVNAARKEGRKINHSKNLRQKVDGDFFVFRRKKKKRAVLAECRDGIQSKQPYSPAVAGTRFLYSQIKSVLLRPSRIDGRASRSCVDNPNYFFKITLVSSLAAEVFDSPNST